MSACRFLAASVMMAALGSNLASQSVVAKGGAMSVDAQLALAVDISYSMDEEEQHLQREGISTPCNHRNF